MSTTSKPDERVTFHQEMAPAKVTKRSVRYEAIMKPFEPVYLDNVYIPQTALGMAENSSPPPRITVTVVIG